LNITLTPDFLRELDTRLNAAHKSQSARYPGWSAERRPIHVFYGGAHLFRAGIARRLGELAVRSLDDFAPDFASFARAIELPGAEKLPSVPKEITVLEKSLDANPKATGAQSSQAWLAHAVYRRVREKLRREPVEDYRIDFEDGYGIRADAEEDAHATAAAKELAAGHRAGELPPFFGLRIKPFTAALRDRSLRTLDLFLSELAAQMGEAVPKQLRITLPKVTLPDEVAALADVCSRLEPLLDFEPGALRIELMIESPRAIFNERGEVAIPSLVAAARGRCIAAHFGPFDYATSLGMAVVDDPLGSQSSNFAREAIHIALAGTGVALADGPTTTLPIPKHRAADGATLNTRQREENTAVVHAAWRAHFQNVRCGLETGFYQGWDLHPAQLPIRYAATYAFFLENLDTAAHRLCNFVESAAQATRLGHVFDDAANARGLANHLLLAINCGATTAGEVQSATGLAPEDLLNHNYLSPR
jgi:citrate lyase beta subunit